MGSSDLFIPGAAWRLLLKIDPTIGQKFMDYRQSLDKKGGTSGNKGDHDDAKLDSSDTEQRKTVTKARTKRRMITKPKSQNSTATQVKGW